MAVGGGGWTERVGGGLISQSVLNLEYRIPYSLPEGNDSVTSHTQ